MVFAKSSRLIVSFSERDLYLCMFYDCEHSRKKRIDKISMFAISR